MRSLGVILMLALVACGRSRAPSSPQPSASTAASASAAPNATDDATRAHARQIMAAATDLRREKSGACPTLDDVLDKYTFAPGTELDGSGARFTITCSDKDVAVNAADGHVVAAQEYSGVLRSRLGDAPQTSTSPSTITNTTPSNADRILAQVRPRVKNCYRRALAQNPDLAGAIHGRIVINADGSVKEVDIDKSLSTLNDANVIACLKNVITTTGPYAPTMAGVVEF